jgi:hypothetical protein
MRGEGAKSLDVAVLQNPRPVKFSLLPYQLRAC